MSEIELKKEVQQLKAENERLKKHAAAPAAQTEDRLGIVQQVQGVVNGYMTLRNRVAELEAELNTRNEDNRRLQKMVADLNKGKA